MEEVWVEEGVGKVRYGLGQEQQLVTSEQKITLGEMRAAAVRDLLVYCADYKCSHGMRMSADRWPDYVRLSVFPSGIKYRQSAASTEPAKIPGVSPTIPAATRGVHARSCTPQFPDQFWTAASGGTRGVAPRPGTRR